MALPKGFVLEPQKTSNLPEGFVLESDLGLASLQKPQNAMTADEYRAQLAAREAQGYDRTLGGTAIDAGVTALKAAIGLPEAFVGLADIPTMGYAGKLLEDMGYKPKQAKEILDTYLSEAQQAANRRVKETKGFLPTIGAALENPSVIATSVGESIPQMLGGAGVARGLMKAAPGVAPWLAGALGEGVMGAGSAAEQIRQEAKDKLLSGKQVLSALGSGAGTAAFGAAAGRLANKLGLGDVETMLAGGAGQGAKSVGDFAKKLVGSGISEGIFEELPQSAQEQMWMNYATDKPLMDGVAEAAGMGAVTGAAMGMGATALQGRRREQPTGLPSVVPETPVAPAPEAGIAALMPQPPAPPAPPAAPVAPAATVAEEEAPAQDMEAMLREALAATESDINTVNMTEAPVAEAPVAPAPAEKPVFEEPPSTKLIEETLPEVEQLAPEEQNNGFIEGQDGYRTRISQHEKGSNALDPNADIGAFMYEVRKGSEDSNPLNMVLNKDGKLVPASSVLTDNKSNGTAWVPPNAEAAKQVESLLEKRAKTAIGSSERKAVDAEILAAVKENKPLVNKPTAEQPPSTELIKQVLPEPTAKERPSTPEIYNAIIDGWQGVADKLPEATRTWMTENGLIQGKNTTPLGQRLMDTVKQAEEAYKSSQSVGALEAMRRGEPMPTPKSMSTDQVDQVIDNFLAANKPKAKPAEAPKPEVKPVAEAPTAPPAEAPAAKPAEIKEAPGATGDEAAKAKAKQDLEDALGDLSMLMTKGTRLNIVPEEEQKLLPILTKAADAAFRLGYYKFKDAAKFVMDLIRSRLGDDVADQITLDHLQGAYIGMAGKYQDQGASSKQEVIAVESLEELNEEEAPAADEAPEGMDINDPDAKFQVAQEIAQSFLNNGEYRDITEARKAISEMTGVPIKPGTAEAKAADEAIEAGVVMAAREIIAKGRKDELTAGQIYDKLVNLYERQPNLNVRSSTSVAEQAYSTPAPLAFIASELAGITNKTTVYEPTAGNGMLVIGANPKNVVANELNKDRYEMLTRILKGAEVVNKNGMNFQAPISEVVIANPPFGAIGEEVSVNGVKTREIDHAIVYNSLGRMQADGRSVLIVGGVQAKTEDGRREGYRGAQKRNFYYNLYKDYNVVDHFTVGGNMYGKQGTTFPVDVIVIDGKGQSQRNLPAADLPELITSYEQLKEKLNDRMVSRGDRGTTGADIGTGTEGRVEPEGVDRGAVGEGEQPSGERGRPAGGGERGVSESESTRGGQREPAGGRAGEVQPGSADESKRGAEGQPVPSEGKRGEAGGKAGTEGRKPSELGGVSVVSGERVESGLKERAKKEEETANQVSYTPHSQATAVGTLVPKAMAQAIEDSIAKVEAQVGNVDEFVAEQLEMDPETLREQFSGEQIDALVLAIRNAEEGKGFIIGDQTGVGKGRVVAAMIKYALNTGKIPIFVTEKPNLYSDMIRDLDDIGMTDELGLDTAKPKIFMTNGDVKVPYTLIRSVKGEVVENELTLKPAKSSGLDEVMKQMIKGDSLGDYKVIFTTYSQLQSVKGKATERQNFIKHFGAGNYMIFDESHNAGGAGVEPSKAEKEAGVNIGQGRSAFVRNLVKAADGTFFSSATYAKRPDVMDLYSSTDMKLAVDNITQLSDAIKAGGIPMQQTVANMLTQAGQYIRRERTFAGVSYNTQETKVDKDTAENMATSMRDILAFSREKEAVVKGLQKSFDKQGERLGGAGEKTTVQGANFGSIMHNLIDQMLLSLKAQDSVRHAVERLKAGEKVVLTVSNTMGSFLQSYADDMQIGVGDPVNLSFADLYIRYLEKQRMVTIKKPGGKKEEYRLTDEDLGENLANRYYEILDFIRGAGFGSAPISPIDYMHSELRKAGYKTEEITGRTVTLNYESGKPLLASRSANIKQRVNAVKAFNNGTADVIILNQAGSTGLSLHASNKVKDQRKRHMIIVQPEKNIDTHMQMLGRVHRTGQVIPPAYSQMMADIPAEMRPAAVLLKKMASLSANTTASRKSAVSAEGAVDFMNDYGGQIAQEYLRDNPEIYQDLGGEKITQLKDNTEEADETDIRRLTGYIPILPIKVQEEVYKDLIERYNDLIEREDSMGSNKLEAKAQDLDAQTISSKAITEDKGEPSIFAQPAYMERVDVKRTVKPYSRAEVEEMVKTNKAKFKDNPKFLFKQIDAEAKAYADEQLADAQARGADPVRLAAIENQIRSQREHVKTIIINYSVGSNVAIKNTNGVFVYGVVTEIDQKGKTKNPVAGSDWKMTIALANGDAKSLPLTFSQIGTRYTLTVQNEVQYLNPETLQNERILLPELFDRGATVRREKRWMVTGNVLAGFAAVNNIGTILQYTKNDGTTGQGILMPRTFDFEKEQKNAPIRLKTYEDVKRFFDTIGRGAVVSTPDSVLRIRNEGNGYMKFITSSSKREGGTFFLDKTLTGLIGDFYKSGSLMSSLSYSEAANKQAIEYILNDRQDSLIAASNKEEAREMFAPKDIPLSSIKFDTERLSLDPAMNRAMDREALIRQYQSVRQKSAAISAKFAKGEAGLDEQKALTFLKQASNDLKDSIETTKPEGRLAKNFFAKATDDWNKELISDDVYDVIRSLHDKYPDVLEGIGNTLINQLIYSITASRRSVLEHLI